MLKYKIPQIVTLTRNCNNNFHTTKKSRKHRTVLAGFFYLKRAENETRTRDPNLGKVMLYQLSYFRNV